jgi:integrase/recombinase XerD
MSKKQPKKLLSKKQIDKLKFWLYPLGIPGIKVEYAKTLCWMAEEYRKIVWKKRIEKRSRKRTKKYLKATDRLSIEQLAKILNFVISAADRDRKKTKALTRAVQNEAIVITLAETGVRVEELCNLKLKNLPGWHGHEEIEVEKGKGNKDRTVGVSRWFSDYITEYVNKYRGHEGEKGFLFKSERGGRLSEDAVRSRIHWIGLQVGIWVYQKNGRTISKLTPHKFRHSYATIMLDVTENISMVQDQLGHDDIKTTRIYARILSEQRKHKMKDYHKTLFSGCNKGY